MSGLPRPEAPAYGLWPETAPSLVPPFLRDLPACTDGALAVYDADGTMWRDDVADDFTRFMIDRGEIPGDDWDEYMRIYRADAPAGCRFLLTLYRGMTASRLAERVDHWWLAHARRRWVREVVESIYHVSALGYPVWVVSGTPTDLLLPLTRMLPVERILGMDFELDGRGVITGRLSGISCAGTGKAEKLTCEASGRRVVLCAGNGDLDGAMMELAERPWSVYPNPAFEAHSRRMGWPVLPRPADFVEEQKLVG